MEKIASGGSPSTCDEHRAGRDCDPYEAPTLRASARGIASTRRFLGRRFGHGRCARGRRRLFEETELLRLELAQTAVFDRARGRRRARVARAAALNRVEALFAGLSRIGQGADLDAKGNRAAHVGRAVAVVDAHRGLAPRERAAHFSGGARRAIGRRFDPGGRRRHEQRQGGQDCEGCGLHEASIEGHVPQAKHDLGFVQSRSNGRDDPRLTIG